MKWFLLIFVALPTMLMCIHGIIKPKESFMFGWRWRLNFMFGRSWQSNNELEPSEFALDMHRLSCIVVLIIMFIVSVGIILTL